MPHPRSTTFTHVNSYRVTITGYPSRRKMKMVVPAKSQHEAERKARAIFERKYGDQQGYNVQIKHIANYYRERDD